MKTTVNLIIADHPVQVNTIISGLRYLIGTNENILNGIQKYYCINDNYIMSICISERTQWWTVQHVISTSSAPMTRTKILKQMSY